MKPQPFFVEYLYREGAEIAEVKPCCQENNAYYYDIFIRNEYQFTVTLSADDESGMSWKVSLKNADKSVEKALIDAVGQEIEKHLLTPL